MTKEQAINILELYSGNRFGIISEDFWNAVNLALDSLKSTDNDEPDWSKAPEWANYYGIDGDGSRWWYELKPTVDATNYDQSNGEYRKDDNPDRMKLFKRPQK